MTPALVGHQDVPPETATETLSRPGHLGPPPEGGRRRFAGLTGRGRKGPPPGPDKMAVLAIPDGTETAPRPARLRVVVPRPVLVVHPAHDVLCRRLVEK